MLTEIQSKVARWTSSLASGFIGLLEPSLSLIFICLIFVAVDIYSAWDLSRRLKIKYNIKKEDFGKFTSEKAGEAFDTIIKVMVLIILAGILDTNLLEDSYNLASYVAVAFCVWEFWSILENFSSENDKAWAKILQKIMVNKAKRHLDDINLEEILKEESENREKEAREEVEKEKSRPKYGRKRTRKPHKEQVSE